MGFYLKKILSPFLLPPGIFVLLLVVSGAWFLRKGWRKAGAVNLVIAVTLWSVSVSPVSDALMRGLEHSFSIPSDPKGDVIVILGGGSYLDAPDLSGKGFPNGDMLGRVVTAARLQQRLRIPVIISSGKVYSDTPSEAPVIRRILKDLGVPEGMITLEERSRDTRENALYSKQICERMGLSHIILVTSAYHMKRSVLSFSKAGVSATPFPAAFHTSAGDKDHRLADCLPNAGALMDSYAALHEHLGLLFYGITY